MVIIETCYRSFDEYLNVLSKPAKKNYIHTRKHNADLYFENVSYDKNEIEKFMQLWEKQTVFGKSIQWCFPYHYIEGLAKSNKLLCFRAKKENQTIAVHFIQKRVGFWECHPPMYEKNSDNEKRYLAKYMWFSLIKFCIEHKLPPLDMGGGIDNWRDTILRRIEFPNLNYKWTYVPEKVKLNPEKERPYIIKHYGSEKILDYDNKILTHPKNIKFLAEAILLRLRYQLFNNMNNEQHLNHYSGEPIQWTEVTGQNLFISQGIYDDGWTEKRVFITFMNKDIQYVRMIIEFPEWSQNTHTIISGKLNNKRFIKSKINAGQTELNIGPLHKRKINTIILSMQKKFKMPEPDTRSCYLRIVKFYQARVC